MSSPASFAVSVTTTATPLVQSGQPTPVGQLDILNKGAVSIYLGVDNTVTSVTGFEIAAGAKQHIYAARGDVLYAIAASATADVRILALPF